MHLSRRAWLVGLGGLGGLVAQAPARAAAPCRLDPQQPRRRAPVAPHTLTWGLEHPWALAFLPDGGMLVTERAGRLRRLDADGTLDPTPVAGLPPVSGPGEGGLLDLALDPDFAREPWVYWTYGEAGTGAEAGLAGTAVARGRLHGHRLDDVQVLYRQQPKTPGDTQFGARLAFAPDKTFFVALGDRRADQPDRPDDTWSQRPSRGQGKVLRLQRDGRPAPGTPTVPGGVPGLWTRGHRNPQGLALHPRTGEPWLVEHGPLGGDELNRLRPGHNYGWPLRSYGCPYGSAGGAACRLGGGTHAPAFDEPLATWLPVSTAPSGLCFYTGARYPGWQGSLFVGALAGRALWRLRLRGGRVVAAEALLGDLGERIRDVRQGPDGLLYLLTDAPQGRLLRLLPTGPSAHDRRGPAGPPVSSA